MENYLYKNYRDKSLQTILERRVGQIFSPLDTFIRKQSTAAFLLSIVTITSITLANLFLDNPIAHVSEIEIGFLFKNKHFTMPLLEWVNSGLMTFFFFILGLEIKNSIVVGTLRNLKIISLIIFTAIGGMVVPSILYMIFNYDGPGAHGWAIPIATDTVFAIGVLAIVARKISIGISIFLTTLAIFDDIGTILIIAIFYTDQLQFALLLQALIPFFLLVCTNKMGITNGWIYAILGGVLWTYIHASGTHATLAGLLLACTVPAKVYIHKSNFLDKARGLLNIFEKNNEKVSVPSSKSQLHLTEEIHKYMQIVTTPLQRWELLFINFVTIVVLPLFVFFNANIVISSDIVTPALRSPIVWGIVIGLVIGKPLGIILFSYIGIKLKLGRLPKGVSMKEVTGISMVAGIGFTMSIFIANLAFNFNPELGASAKFGILLASSISACIALVYHKYFYRTRIVE